MATKANKVTKMTVVTIHDGVVWCVWFELLRQIPFVNTIILWCGVIVKEDVSHL